MARAMVAVVSQSTYLLTYGSGVREVTASLEGSGVREVTASRNGAEVAGYRSSSA